MQFSFGVQLGLVLLLLFTIAVENVLLNLETLFGRR
jgi:hypothetical protein